MMNKITWEGDRFECNNPELEEAKWRVIHSRHRLSEFMKACDLPVWNYVVHLDRSIVIYKPLPDGGLTSFTIADEGTGFNVCFHLGAYAIASMNLGQKLEICAYSFKPLLHPVLFQGLSKWFGDRKAEEIDKKCPYFSGSHELKCAVSPSLPCKDCSDASASFKENLFVWRATKSSDLPSSWMQALEDIAMRGSGFESMRQAFVSAQESMRSLSEVGIPRLDLLSVERIGDHNISVGFSIDISQEQEAIARLCNGGITERPFVAFGEGSEQDAAAIATGFTYADGSIRIEFLEIHADTSEVETAIARMRELISNSAMLPERLLYGEGQGVASHLSETYQCGLSDHITPLPPERIEEESRKYEEEARRRRVWGYLT